MLDEARPNLRGWGKWSEFVALGHARSNTGGLFGRAAYVSFNGI